jgi:tetratricopeptide (TPR) repeat protein
MKLSKKLSRIQFKDIIVKNIFPIKIFPKEILQEILSYKNIFLFNQSEHHIYKKYKDCVLKIVAYNSEDEYVCHGSAVVLRSENMVVTNFHNIKDAYTFKLLDDNNNIIEYDGIVCINPEKDVVIFSVRKEIADRFPDIKYDKVGNFKVTDEVFSISFQADSGKIFTSGKISGLNETVKNHLLKFGGFRKNLFTFTADISPGSSGGAIINKTGKIIGISTFTDIRGQSLNYSITLKEIFEMIEKSKKEKNDQDYFYKINKCLYNYNNYLKNGRFLEAIDEIDEFVDNYKIESFYLLLKLKVHLLLEDYYEIIKLSEFGKNLFPEDCSVYNYYIALSNIYLENYSKAINIIENTTGGYADCTDFNYLYGLAYYKMGKYEKAIEKFSVIKNDKIVGWEFYYFLACAYKNNNETYKAVRTIYKGIELFKDSYSLYYCLFDLYYSYALLNKAKKWQYEKALKFIDKSIYMIEHSDLIDMYKKDYLTMHYQKASLLLNMYKTGDALKLINLYIGNFPNEIHAYLIRASINIQKGDYDSALSDYMKIINYDCENCFAYAGLALLNAELNKFYEANDNIITANNFFKEETISSQDQILFFNTTATVYYKLGDFINSKIYCQKVLDKIKNNLNALLILAQIKLTTECIEEARNSYEFLLHNFPNQSRVHFKWGVRLVENKKYDEAIKILTFAIEKSENCAEAYLKRGIAKYYKAKHKMAILDFNKAIEISPNLEDAYYFRGFASFARELYLQAISDWENALTLNYNYENELRVLINEASLKLSNKYIGKLFNILIFIPLLFKKIINIIFKKE